MMSGFSSHPFLGQLMCMEASQIRLQAVYLIDIH
jgi:hypothetical protein